MLAKIQKWGNSQGLRLSKTLLASVDLHVGDHVSISVDNGTLSISPAKKIRGKYDLKELVARIPEDYQPEKINWGHPSGKEVW